MSEVAFAPGTIVRMRNNRTCAGQITGETKVKGGRAYCGVLLADGSGVRMLPASQLEAETEVPDPLEDLEAGRFGDPSVFRRLLIHHRLTGRLRDVIYSMDVTDTDFHAYQFKPVIKILSSPSQSLLLCDEKGLEPGKACIAKLRAEPLFEPRRPVRLLVAHIVEELQIGFGGVEDGAIVAASHRIDPLQEAAAMLGPLGRAIFFSAARPPVFFDLPLRRWRIWERRKPTSILLALREPFGSVADGLAFFSRVAHKPY